MSNRRKFIKQASLGMIGMPFIARGFGDISPSDKIRMAFVGLGGMATAHIKWFSEFNDVDVVAISDVNTLKIDEKQGLLQSLRPNRKVDVYTDFRHIIDRKDIDAISCVTPDHWHALVALMAFESGKDVYGEKPLSHNVKEGQVMLKNLQKYNRVFQMGTQIHAGENYHRVAEIIQSGVLGKIHTVRLWKTEKSKGWGFPAIKTPPGTLDWEMWLGPAPFVPYDDIRSSWRYRYFYDYSGGVFADFWCHIADIVYMSLDPKGLKEISSRGERRNDGVAETPYWFEADLKYDDLDLYWTTDPPNVPGAKNMDIGAHFEGENGTLICDYENKKVQIGNESFDDLTEIPITLKRSPGHQRNFLDSVKSREQPESNLAYARRMTLPMHLALISFRLKRKLIWDERQEKFIGDDAANSLLSRTYRAPWSLSSYE